MYCTILQFALLRDCAMRDYAISTFWGGFRDFFSYFSSDESRPWHCGIHAVCDYLHAGREAERALSNPHKLLEPAYCQYLSGTTIVRIFTTTKRSLQQPARGFYRGHSLAAFISSTNDSEAYIFVQFNFLSLSFVFILYWACRLRRRRIKFSDCHLQNVQASYLV